MNPPTADQASVRKHNTALTLDVLRHRAPLSRAELAGLTGLNRSTISSIIADLLEQGLICETELQTPTTGRPGMLLTLNPNGGAAVGVEIGVDFISIVLSDFEARILWQQHTITDPDAEQITILERAESLTAEALSIAATRGLHPLGIGLGIPGLVDVRQGKLIFAPNLHWHDVPLRLMWTQRFGLPVYVENEANAAALGEYTFGVAKDIANFLYLSAGVGLGGGIVIDGQLYRGSHGFAGEIGHMTLYPDGKPCGCGKVGCWETVVGPRALIQRVRTAIQAGGGLDGTTNSVWSGDPNAITVEAIVEAAEAGDEIALNALDDVAHHLSLGIANLVNIFNPELVVLGGALNTASDFLLPVIEKTVKKNVLAPSQIGLRIAPSAHGADACVMGAVALVLDEVLRMPNL
ncbi:MAG TPA: ROK family transcriptional regulator [bacterium]|nr:ROK family transcriptional regulator [bacterium]